MILDFRTNLRQMIALQIKTFSKKRKNIDFSQACTLVQCFPYLKRILKFLQTHSFTKLFVLFIFITTSQTAF